MAGFLQASDGFNTTGTSIPHNLSPDVTFSHAPIASPATAETFSGYESGAVGSTNSYQFAPQSTPGETWSGPGLHQQSEPHFQSASTLFDIPPSSSVDLPAGGSNQYVQRAATQDLPSAPGLSTARPPQSDAESFQHRLYNQPAPGLPAGGPPPSGAGPQHHGPYNQPDPGLLAAGHPSSDVPSYHHGQYNQPGPGPLTGGPPAPDTPSRQYGQYNQPAPGPSAGGPPAPGTGPHQHAQHYLQHGQYNQPGPGLLAGGPPALDTPSHQHSLYNQPGPGLLAGGPPASGAGSHQHGQHHLQHGQYNQPGPGLLAGGPPASDTPSHQHSLYNQPGPGLLAGGPPASGAGSHQHAQHHLQHGQYNQPGPGLLAGGPPASDTPSHQHSLYNQPGPGLLAGGPPASDAGSNQHGQHHLQHGQYNQPGPGLLAGGHPSSETGSHQHGQYRQQHGQYNQPDPNLPTGEPPATGTGSHLHGQYNQPTVAHTAPSSSQPPHGTIWQTTPSMYHNGPHVQPSSVFGFGSPAPGASVPQQVQYSFAPGTPNVSFTSHNTTQPFPQFQLGAQQILLPTSGTSQWVCLVPPNIPQPQSFVPLNTSAQAFPFPQSVPYAPIAAMQAASTYPNVPVVQWPGQLVTLPQFVPQTSAAPNPVQIPAHVPPHIPAPATVYTPLPTAHAPGLPGSSASRDSQSGASAAVSRQSLNHPYPSPVASSSFSAGNVRHFPAISSLRTPSHSGSRVNTHASGPYAKALASHRTFATESAGESAGASEAPGAPGVPVIPVTPNRLKLITATAKLEFGLRRLIRGPTLTKDNQSSEPFVDALDFVTAALNPPLSAEETKKLSEAMCRFWDRKRRTLKEKSEEIVESRFIDAQVEIENGTYRDIRPDEKPGRVERLIGPRLELFCKEPSADNEGIIQGFDEDTIYELLETLVFGGNLAGSFGINHPERFGGMYTIPAVAFVCTSMHCSAKAYETNPKTSYDFSYTLFHETYVRYYRLLAGMWDHPYHGPRLRKLLTQHFRAACQKYCPQKLTSLPPMSKPESLAHVHKNRHLQDPQIAINFNLGADGLPQVDSNDSQSSTSYAI